MKLTHLKTGRIVEIYNELNPTKPVKKFRDRTTAETRLLSVVSENSKFITEELRFEIMNGKTEVISKPAKTSTVSDKASIILYAVEYANCHTESSIAEFVSSEGFGDEKDLRTCSTISSMIKTGLLKVIVSGQGGNNDCLASTEKALDHISANKKHYESRQVLELPADFTNCEWIVPGPKSKVAGKRIYKVSESNPRRAGTNGWHSFNLIKDGMTFEEYKGAGGRNNDLSWDIDHGYVEVK